ncbi:MAG: hypothetical protein JW981_00015 [Anaerolineae bacterium]|nr:hypothetical protein [Anaerolineae bacterium]
MFQKISSSWQLLKASAGVLWADKELVVFPIISAVGTLIVTASFVIPIFTTELFAAFVAAGWFFSLIGAFIFYFVEYAIILFANTALVGAALIRLRGGNPTVRDGFYIAVQCVDAIVGYALISSTIGALLRWIEEQDEIASLFSTLFGFGWSLASYLVIPIIAVENIGPAKAVERSATLLQQTWGEQIAGNFNISLIFGLVSAGLVFLGAVGSAIMLASGAIMGVIVIIGVLIPLLVLISLLDSTLSGIYSAALYHYATGGQDGYFESDVMEQAFG